MLVQFRTENHRSLRDEQVLTMVASSASDKSDAGLIAPEGLGERLLPALALYGANASGKSNVLLAIGFMRDAVLLSHRLWAPDLGTPHNPFALSEKAAEPSLFEVDILVDEVRYRYGFVLGATRIEEEWLHSWPKGRKQVWFEREADEFDFGKHMPGENETIRRLTRNNSLFLSAAAQNNHPLLMPIFRWFEDVQYDFQRVTALSAALPWGTLKDLFADSAQGSLFPEIDLERKQTRDIIVQLLRAADIGIVDMRLVPREQGRFDPRGGQALSRRRFDLLFRHKAADPQGAWLPLEAESAGTVTLLGIAARLVGALRRGALLCVDELEASLHPTLALELLRLFQDPRHNPHGAQLVFSTHDTNLLGTVVGQPSLRRDQIWFTEKDPTGATHLYPLTDFHPRKEENFERGYLQGRYGAIPVLSDLLPAPAEDT